jgi:Ca2+-binding RTX toxin-like protein
VSLVRGAVAAVIAASCLLTTETDPARGATAKVVVKTDVNEFCGKFDMCTVYPELAFTAANGERNSVTVTVNPSSPGSLGNMVVRDAGAVITPASGCSRLDDNGVTCTVPPGAGSFWSASISTADMNDSVLVSGSVSTVMHGGAGDDRLTGGDSGDVIAGDAGSDTLLGGGGFDTLQGDDASSAAPDVLDGGHGHDTVSYEGRRAGVSVTLGRRGGEDKLTSFESVRGGRGDDVLVGDAGFNTLEGGSGADRLSGRKDADTLLGGDGADRLDGGPGPDTLKAEAGADRLTGGAGKDFLSGGTGPDRARGGRGSDRLNGGDGADRLDGGVGNDVLDLGLRRRGVEDGAADVIGCGPGKDAVLSTDARDLVPSGCEHVDLFYFKVDSPPRLAGPFALRVRCTSIQFVARLRVSRAGKQLGKSRHVRHGGSVTIPLSRPLRAGAVVVLHAGRSVRSAYAVKIAS